MTGRSRQLDILIVLLILFLIAATLAAAGLRGQVVDEADEHHHSAGHGAGSHGHEPSMAPIEGTPQEAGAPHEHSD